MLKNYDFVTAETLAYFSQRPPQAERDSRFALDYVKAHARTPETQRSVLKRARVQMRRAVGDAGRALSRLCRAQAHSARRLCAAGSGAYHQDARIR
jgi:pyrroloquinoline quinone (PQQ) biosynthesis protein C